jgi:TonB family protein
MLHLIHPFSARPAINAASLAPLLARALVGLGILMLIAAPAGAAGDQPSQAPRAGPPAARQTELSKPPLGSLDTPAMPRDPFAPSDEEELPPVGRDKMFNEMQIRFCHAQLARINAVRPLLDRYQAEHVKHFNAQVADLNSRCGSYRYMGSALGDARAWVEANRVRIEQDARSAYTQRFAGEAVVRGLDEGRPAVPPQPAPVERSIAPATPARDQGSPAIARDEARPAASAAVSPAPASARTEERRVSAAQRPEAVARADTPAREPERSAASQAVPAAAPPPRVQSPAAQATAAAKLPPATSYGAAQPPPAQAATAATPVPGTPPSAARPPAQAAAAAEPAQATPPAAAQPPAEPTAAAAATPAAAAQPPAQTTTTAGPAPATPPASAQPPAQAAATPAPPPATSAQSAQPPATQTAALPPAAPPAAPSPQPRAKPATGAEAALERLTQDIQRDSAQVLEQPPGASAKDADLTTQIELRYAAGGYIKSIVVGESSGSDLLDRQALEVARALRYPAVPEALQARDFAVRFPIVFRARR